MDYYSITALLLAVVIGTGNSVAQDCNSEPADVIFVLDSSYSIWPPDFYRELTFADNVIKSFNVGPGPDQTRVGLLTFGHEVWPKFYLDSFFDKSSLSLAINRIRYGEGKTTNTGDALAYTKNIMMSERAGGRKNVTKIVIVVSDGLSQKTWFTQDMARLVQEDGMFLFAISIGFKLDHKELAGIASDPDKQYFFSIDEHSDMSYIKKTIDERVCQASDEDDDKWDTTTDKFDEFRASEDVLILDCADKKADIFFVIDSSYSINPDNFAKEMEFIRSVIDVLDIGPNKTRIGIMTFSDKVDFLVKLEYNLEKEDFLSYVNAVDYMGGGTDTATALRRLREEGFFGPKSQIRDDVSRIAIVLTDGLSLTPDVTAREATLLKKMGVQIFSVGIGSGIDKRELEDIASEPVDKFVVHVDNFATLSTVRMKLAARSCTVPPSDFFPFSSDQAVCHPIKPTDLLFIFDAQSLGSWRSQSISQFISKSLAEFHIASSDFRVGREIENCPSGNIPIGSALHYADLDQVKFPSFTDMLNRINRNRMSDENGGRRNASKMAVLFVDSSQRMNFETFTEARKLKDSVDFFFVVTIGQSLQTSHLTGLAGKEHSISVNSYDELPPLADKLMSSMCDFFFLSF